MSQDFGNKNQLFKTPPKNITNPFPNIQSNALRPESTLPHHFAKVFYVLYATTPTLKAQYTVLVSLINPPKRPSPKTTPKQNTQIYIDTVRGLKTIQTWQHKIWESSGPLFQDHNSCLAARSSVRQFI